MDDLILEAVVPAPPMQVYAAWTEQAEVERWFCANCAVEARLGGPFEMYFITDAPEGSRGSEGCAFLALDPPGALAFSWNFPPHLPTIRDARTRVDLTFEVHAEGTALTLRQSGWGEGGEWPAGHAYFDAAWRRVLDALIGHFSPG
jgi:uncharacterized protein YndB with AHSA1/START domain